MALHGKEMTPEENKMILGLSEQDYSGNKIGILLGMNSRTINKFLKRFHDCRSEGNNGRSSWKKKIDPKGMIGSFIDCYVLTSYKFYMKSLMHLMVRLLSLFVLRQSGGSKNLMVSRGTQLQRKPQFSVNHEKRKQFCWEILH